MIGMRTVQQCSFCRLVKELFPDGQADTQRAEHAIAVHLYEAHRILIATDPLTV